MSLVIDVATGAVRGGTSILFVALGETIAERAGVVNLGAEGSMLTGALAAYAVTAETGDPLLGAAAGAAAGALLALVHAVLVLSRGANQLANGLVVLFLGLGLTSLFGAAYVGRSITTFEPYAVPLLSDIPVLGPVLFDHDPLTYASYLVAPAMWWLLYRSRWGLALRAAGERPEVLRTYGRSPLLVRYLAVVAGGLLAGIGGAQLSTAYANAWFENMTAGRGFIAVSLVIFAAWHPLRAVAGAYLFGAALALSPALQARGIGLNQFVLDALPYLVTLIALVVLGRRRGNTAPESLAKVFDMTGRST
ncbi:ABC transporter permease [Dactylosporangium sp. NPDC000244]|uniref:ABC transporter permease n=1 Tax=Dactylosporangium sp. NPDC000244 TaxID=3154365 RepID=UPI0033207CF3